MADTLPIAEDFAEAVGREEESSSARDDDDLLIRRERATRERFQESVSLTIDGYPVVIPKSVPKTDAQGNELRDAAGELIPRNTTLYDAAMKLVTGYKGADGRFVPPVWSWDDLKERIPVLCHMPHLHPVGVCRMCSVYVSTRIEKGGKIELKGNRKLTPACWHETRDGLAINTRAGLPGLDAGARGRMSAEEFKLHEDAAKKAGSLVNKSVGLLAEMLLADHKPEVLEWTANGKPHAEGKRYENELEAVAGRLGVTGVRDRLKKPDGAFSRNRMAVADPSDSDPRLPHTKPLRRIPLDLLSPTPVPAEDRELGATPLAAWEAWNELVDERFPYSSRTVVVDHDKCIVCDRCVRSCSQVKPFEIIGHTGKGYATRISFGLDALWGPRDRADGSTDPNLLLSGCVQCGECMTACPTGALSLRRRVQPQAWKDDSPKLIPQNPNTPFPAGSGFLTADEMRDLKVEYVSPVRGKLTVQPFRTIPYAYLKWNEGAVRRIEIPPGQSRALCREGDYGSTAFLLSGRGDFWIYEWEQQSIAKPSWLDKLLGRKPKVVRPTPPPEPDGHPEYGWRKFKRQGSDLLLGEMACLTNQKRTATVVAEAAATEPAPVIVYEITRNMLDMMQRAEDSRDDIADVYTARAVQVCLSKSQLFEGLTYDQERQRVDFLLQSRQLEYRRVQEGEVIVREGEKAADFYMIRLGTVEITTTFAGRKHVHSLRTTGEFFGEVSLMEGKERGATASALDPTELIRVPGKLFLEFLKQFPDVKEKLLTATYGAVKGLDKRPPPGALDQYVELGLYQAQKVLALDLLSCTRCDECTKACAASHDGHARLLREGKRFGDFLIAASCRSCHKPYCMEGCPVDAIHRKGDRLEVVIEDHCIGCGLCERNCPYGSIHMVPRETPNLAALAAEAVAVGGNPHLTAARRAVNCDLCGSVGGQPFCVSACPHEAAFRMDGLQLLNEVTVRATW
ncbi:MAG: cyclic nucleotide-binding domain-containing protein [Gemmataceae bacterium]